MISAKKLMKMAKKWQKFAAIRSERLISFPGNNTRSGSDSCSTSSVVEKGHFGVYTADQKRFVVPLAYLDNIAFRQLLKMSEEEYGLPTDGPIILPCDSVFMDYLICSIRQQRAADLHDVLLKSVACGHCSLSCLPAHGFALLDLKQILNYVSESVFRPPIFMYLTSICISIINRRLQIFISLIHFCLPKASQERRMISPKKLLKMARKWQMFAAI